MLIKFTIYGVTAKEPMKQTRLVLHMHKTTSSLHMRDSREGGQGAQTPPTPPPLKSHKNIGFLGNTGPDPLNNSKATKAAFNVRPSSARQRKKRCQSWMLDPL